MKSSEIGVVTTKGQLVIPARLRRRLGVRQGTRVSFSEDAGRIIVQPITRDFIKSLQGSLKGKPSALEYLLQERKRERPHDLVRGSPRRGQGERAARRGRRR